MTKNSIAFILVWVFVGLLSSVALKAEQTGNCTAGTDNCEQNSLSTTNSTTTNNTNNSTNQNTNVNTNSSTNVNTSTSTSSATNVNQNTSTSNNVSTATTTASSTSNATSNATTNNTSVNTNLNTSNSTSNSTVNSTVNQNVTNTMTSSSENINQNTSVSTSTAENKNINQSTSESNVTTDNKNMNFNQTTAENTNRNINESSSTQRIEQDIKTRAPPASSIAPSIMSYSQDLCTTGRSGAFQGQVFGISGGRTITDENCERLKLSKYIYDMGMKVAAVSILCQDQRVFKAMEMSGTPCPYYGKIGKEASEGWKSNPSKRPDAKEYKANWIKQCKRGLNPNDTGYNKDVVSGVRKAFTSKTKTTKQCKKEWRNTFVS